jgi:hypothetical protein
MQALRNEGTLFFPFIPKQNPRQSSEGFIFPPFHGGNQKGVLLLLPPISCFDKWREHKGVFPVSLHSMGGSRGVLLFFYPSSLIPPPTSLSPICHPECRLCEMKEPSFFPSSLNKTPANPRGFSIRVIPYCHPERISLFFPPFRALTNGGNTRGDSSFRFQVYFTSIIFLVSLTFPAFSV